MTREKRNALIEEHLDEVGFIAREMARKLPPCFDVDDLEAVGAMALIDVAERFDPAQGKFWTFARHRVRGAMLDHAKAEWRDTCHVELPEVRLFSSDDAEGDVIQKELKQQLDRAMGKLTPREREVVVRGASGQRNKDVAKDLKITSSTVGVLKRNAIARLKREVAA